MLPKTHFLVGLIASIILFFLFPSLSVIQILVFLSASFLIDFDHYLYFVVKKESLNLKKAYIFFRCEHNVLSGKTKEERKKYCTGIYIFHGIESLIISSLLGYFLFPIFYMVTGGIFLHLILDWIQKAKNPEHPRKISIIYDLYNFRKKKLI